MFTLTAKWYDALYRFKDYRKESNEIIHLIRKMHPNARQILDVACGTAEHDTYLLEHFIVDGLDINPEFIQIAKNKIPQGTFYIADMTDFNLAKKYDVILCLFSSIGYVKTLENVKKSISCFANHLSPDGIIIIEPWFTEISWQTSGQVYLLTGESDEGKICRMSISEKDNTLSVLNFHYMIGTKNGIQYLQERHELGLFSKEEMTQCFDDNNLDVEYNDAGPSGRGIYIAKKR